MAEMTRGLGCSLLVIAPQYMLLGELLAVLEEHGQVYTDTSWQITPGCIELLVEHASPDRVMFGPVAPLRPIQPALNMVLESDLDEQVKRKVIAGNALRFFGRGAEAEQAESSRLPLPEVKVPATSPIDVHCHLGVVPAMPLKRRDVEAIEYYVEGTTPEILLATCSPTWAWCRGCARPPARPGMAG